MKVGIRADGGSKRGIGHLVRSGVLADRFLEEGYEVTYLTRTPGTVVDVCSSRVNTYELDAQHPQKDAIEWIENTGTEIVISDCYDVDTATQEAIAGVADCFVVIQVDDRHDLCCDILVNGNLFGPDVEYQWQGSEPTWCVGIDYVLLQEKFQELAKQSPKYRSSPESALITMGGSDVTNTTPTAMRAFNGYDLEIDVIIGPGYDNQEEISTVASEISCQFDLIEDPPDLPARMANADIAVSGFGTTAYELLAAKTPFIGIPVVKNQKRSAQIFEKNKLAIVKYCKEDLVEGIQNMMCTPATYHRFGEKYDSLIDGNGTEQIFQEIQSQI
ncbi:UDP-2,4-diacetamido-2,4,6-trideoxy-beta-L-altropyranose hydrolase [Halostagnicola sp. A-GB9-2]|uniref:UDP-2,4-diacetamido-2,4, 6-trideoxy-beta-L-altropyranose hydrolase n=1 Tax=Halostagnicola sp. A-GB9-2 TaxID=3048066 RepID=UPI0024C04E2F|nr:UDP-2,4-diacetamido-2,4,6-trideoxy-beta-L-altropyranose hydrolase [Halostagnicola sp. A-GB9-2]MDJ1431983.1 UDP-2,4-diacetamido-2,4,6-trideoxy-beta-L-altropyranose hydrolase [Halostagnicola sp. A-GB9-2]